MAMAMPTGVKTNRSVVDGDVALPMTLNAK